ncbi:FIST C-terminal domain-containing protein [Flavobacterium sp. CYK-55]|uniref:FIST signal transduction protein n=1 Tax=Flavobacterium sp. CYK-55 TaxID=2835529 RepID=UPI001BCA9BEB|nr:FIST N-terminal domain-containing protein [Flavobacterium sp. CYK-55]MBS7787024.1 FIST C-terminal domain-containing protein [Flavobacterium sp. CYK-55]
MNVEQLLISTSNQSSTVFQHSGFDAQKATLVLAFGQRTLLEDARPFTFLKSKYPNAQIVICSSSGQISNQCVIEDDIVATAIQFEKTQVKATVVDIISNANLPDLGTQIKNDLGADDLKGILVLSEGSKVNGTELIEELIGKTNKEIPIFGGLAGDEYHFEKTIVGLNQDASAGKIVAIGFYGQNICFGFGSEGGWGDFGPEREVTQSHKNVLYKIGDRHALDLYKDYLGKYADELPGSSLYFPLSMREKDSNTSVVRTILSIDEENKSMTFAGNLPEGSSVRLMKANTDRLIEASAQAAVKAQNKVSAHQLALLVSCVGRRIVLDDRVEEELEIVKDTFGQATILCGFYSYGEISPTLDHVACELHNQTMTIATMFEL